MAKQADGQIVEVLRSQDGELLSEWMREQKAASTYRDDLIKEHDLRQQCEEFLGLLRQAASRNSLADPYSAAWDEVRGFLADVSRTWAIKGFSPSQIATFVFSLKKPLFQRLQNAVSNDPVALAAHLWQATELLDAFGLYTTEVHQRTREEVITRQQEEMLELSTPVVTLWDGILALPMIGTLDSARTQVVMESLLQKIVETGSEIAVIDITGVPTVDTLTAQHLLKTVAAARLMGADCIISGIRPQIAQTIVHLGVDLSAVTTKASIADAFRLALKRMGMAVVKTAAKI